MIYHYKRSSYYKSAVKITAMACSFLCTTTTYGSDMKAEVEAGLVEDRHPRHTVQPLKQDKDSLWILSMDGGGIRGIIPAYILKYVEERTEYKQKEFIQQQINQDFGGNVNIVLPPIPVYLAHCFDIMTGTSTGGIIGLGLSVPLEQQVGNSPLPKYKAADLVKLYQENGKIIFSKPKSLLGNLFSKKYDASPIQKVFKEYFGEVSLSQLITPTLVTTYELRREELLVLDSTKAKAFKDEDYHVRDTARATSAAPTFFSAAEIQNFNQESYLCADGGLIANNPAQIAYMRGQALYPHAKKIIMLSLGTGEAVDDRLSNLKEAGLLEWAPHVAPVMMRGVGNLTHQLLRQNSETLGKDVFDYTRIQLSLTTKRAEMDDVTPNNLNYLLQIAKKETESSQPLQDFINLLAKHLANNHVFFPTLYKNVIDQLTKGSRIALTNTIGLPGLSESLETSVLTELPVWEMVKAIKSHGSVQVFETDKVAFSSNGLRYLLEHTPHLHTLGLKDASLTKDLLSLVMVSKPNLTALNLEGNKDLGDESIHLLSLPHLKILNIKNTKLTDVGAQHLTERLSHLEALMIGKNQLTPQGVRNLLKGMANLQTLDLERSDGTAEVIAALPQNLSLTSLNLSHNRIEDSTLARLLSVLEGKGIKTLTLRSNMITQESGPNLKGWLERITTLTELDLGNNNLRDEGAECILDSLRENESLKHLNLSRNFVGVNGVYSLTHVLQVNSVIESLDLRHNEDSLGDEGLEILKESQRSRRMFTLSY